MSAKNKFRNIKKKDCSTKTMSKDYNGTNKDAKTEEVIIDFDTTFTKVSCDNTSNYFKIYMNGLEPERYYQIIIKTILSSGETIIIEDPLNYFKVIR